MTDEINKDREIAKALGMCNESCLWCSIDCKYDFSDRDRLLLLEKMREREDWEEFSNEIGPCKPRPTISVFNYPPLEAAESVYFDLILTKGALRDAAYEWLKGEIK